MTSAQTCSKCGARLHAHSLEGLCSRCMAALAFGIESGLGRQEFGDYELIEEIARGGMGVVYRARDKRLNRVVALKMMLHGRFSNAEFVRRFQTEAEAIAQLRHPSIVTIYEVGECEGYHFLSMELIEGRSFAELAGDKPLPGARAAAYVATIAEAIDYAHRQGVLHRDLKPSNLLLDASDRPRVTDFGLAKLVHSDADLTVTGQSLGSPSYMAPEQAAGRAKQSGAAGDIYSLGAVLYHLITGRPPFQGESMHDVLLQAQSAEPIAPSRLNPSVRADLETICLKCLEKEPVKRYAAAGDLAADLRRFIADEPIRARPVSATERAWRYCRRRPAMSALAAALAVAVAAGVGGVLREWMLARSYARSTRLNLYAADLNLASQAEGRGDIGLARRILAGLAPAPGEEDLRGFEWGYLSRVCRGDEIATLSGHKWIVTCAAFSPDGHKLATGSQDGTAKLWDVDNHQLLATLPNEGGAVWSVAFTSDGKAMMTAGNERQVELWSLDEVKPIFKAPGQVAALSAKGSMLAASDSSPLFWEPVGKTTLWDWRSGRKLRDLACEGRTLALSPDDARLAMAGPHRNVEMIDTATGALVRELPTSNAVWSVAFSPDGEHLLAAGWTDVALEWDLRSGAAPREIKGAERNFWSAVFSPDGSRIATGSSDQTVRLWDAATLAPEAVLRGHGSEVWCVAFRPDGKMMATGSKDQEVMLWNPDKPKAVDTAANPGGIWPFYPQPVEATCVAGSDGILRVYETRTGQTLGTFQGPKPPLRRAVFSPHARRLAVTHELENFARLYDVASGRETRLIGHRDFVAGVAFSPDGAMVATGSMDGTIRLWSSETGRELATLPGHFQETTDVAFSPDGRTLASVAHRESVKLWHVATRRELLSIDLPNADERLQFSPDGKRLAVATANDTIQFFDAQ